jgi:hypothetical protein
MSIFKAIRECITGEGSHLADNKPADVKTPPQTTEEIAFAIISTLFNAEKPGRDLEHRLRDLVSTCGWYEGLAKRILDGLVDALNSGAAMGGAMKEAFDKATAIASELVREHPVYSAAIATVVAIGILALLAPWAVEALGFGELGPTEGEFHQSITFRTDMA